MSGQQSSGRGIHGGSALRILSVVAVVSAVLACRASDDAKGDCIAIAREYQAAMPDALVCDATETGSCSAGRPVIVSQQNDDGTVTLEGLCLCQHAVNPALTATVDAILGRYEAAGCELLPCWCPPPERMPPSCLENGVCSGIWSLAP